MTLEENENPFSTIDEALIDIKAGKFVVVLDDEDRENEGDLIIAAEKVTSKDLAFMVRYTSGVICVGTTEARLKSLGLPQMVPNNEDPKQTAFAISLDYKHGTTTGISAADRAATIRAMADPKAKESDFTRPGHIFPLRYHVGGVLKRCGHTEAGVDLPRLAGLYPAGALSEIVQDDGSMARRPYLQEFSKAHGLKMITIADLIKYRFKRETLVRSIDVPSSLAVNGSTKVKSVNTPYGSFQVHIFESVLNKSTHMVFVRGDPRTPGIAVRVQLECIASDVFMVDSPSYGTTIHDAMKTINALGSGIIVYLRGIEGYGMGLMGDDESKSTMEEIASQAKKENNYVPNVGIGAQILASLGVTSINVLSNNEKRYPGLEGYGIEVIGRIPITKSSQTIPPLIDTSTLS